MIKHFFTVIPKCSKDSNDYLSKWSEQLQVINKQMGKMKKKFYCFISKNSIKIENTKNIVFIEFDERTLLNKYFMNSETDIILSWDNPVRLSDVLRIVISLQNPELIYMDTDILFIKKDNSIYGDYFVAFCIWKDDTNCLELSNSIFHLPKTILIRMINFIKLRLVKREPYFYTEFGPSMFHKLIFNSGIAVRMFSQNHPWSYKIESITRDIKKYEHIFLHLTGAIRKKYLNYFDLVNKITQNLPYSPNPLH